MAAAAQRRHHPGLRLLRREPLEHELSGRAIALTSAWFVGAWVSTGLGTFVLARSVAPEVPLGPLLVTSVCGFALASAAGMFSILVPGVGVRDGVLALLLTLMPLPAAARWSSSPGSSPCSRTWCSRVPRGPGGVATTS